VIVNCWSGPRNVSTALMYAFRQRPDTRVVDEPLYGHYLATTGADHPAAREVVAAVDTDAGRVIRDVILAPCDRPVRFCKQMAHHLTDDVDTGFLADCRNLLLIRDPDEVLTTLVHQIPAPTMRDVGLARQVALFDELSASGQDVPVLDARLLLSDPPAVLARLCERLEVAWEPAMLSWPTGPKPEDGVWAPHWYAGVHRSTGFDPYRPKTAPVPGHVRDLADACRPLYERLLTHAIRP
jgi:hypothetical protein